MEEKHKLAQEIDIAQSLQLLATAYEEISVMKMRIARDHVLRTRDFLSSLANVFINVKSSYKKELATDDKNKHKILQFATHQTNGKEIYVVLSAANKLYGDIVSKTVHLFEEKLQQHMNVDIAIVGKTGKELYDTSRINHPYTFFDIPDVLHSMEELKPLISHILQYEHVTVFYGRFVNIVTQEATASSISGDEKVETMEKEEPTKEYGFIFEPSIEEVLGFFETQIFSSLFKQTIVEAELARLASRIKAMEQAIVFINTRIGTLTLAEKRAKRNIDNKKQLGLVAGMRLWKKRGNDTQLSEN